MIPEDVLRTILGYFCDFRTVARFSLTGRDNSVVAWSSIVFLDADFIDFQGWQIERLPDSFWAAVNPYIRRVKTATHPSFTPPASLVTFHELEELSIYPHKLHPYSLLRNDAAKTFPNLNCLYVGLTLSDINDLLVQLCRSPPKNLTRLVLEPPFEVDDMFYSSHRSMFNTILTERIPQLAAAFPRLRTVLIRKTGWRVTAEPFDALIHADFITTLPDETIRLTKVGFEHVWSGWGHVMLHCGRADHRSAHRELLNLFYRFHDDLLRDSYSIVSALDDFFHVMDVRESYDGSSTCDLLIVYKVMEDIRNFVCWDDGLPEYYHKLLKVSFWALTTADECSWFPGLKPRKRQLKKQLADLLRQSKKPFNQLLAACATCSQNFSAILLSKLLRSEMWCRAAGMDLNEKILLQVTDAFSKGLPAPTSRFVEAYELDLPFSFYTHALEAFSFDSQRVWFLLGAGNLDTSFTARLDLAHRSPRPPKQPTVYSFWCIPEDNVKPSIAATELFLGRLEDLLPRAPLSAMDEHPGWHITAILAGESPPTPDISDYFR